MKYYIGIDPGFDGGVTVMDDEFNIIKKDIAPTILGTKKKMYNVQGMVDLLLKYEPEMVVLEKVHAMPGQGSTSMFRFGHGLGLWEGIINALRYPYALVTPQQWMKTVLVGLPKGDKKQAAQLFCQRRWPEEDWRKNQRCRILHSGLTDSACMAYYAKTLTT